eukprot:829612_1
MASQSDVKRKTIGDVCRFILFSTQTKKPIKKSDLSAIIRKANIPKSQEIIDAARQKLRKGFGFDLIEAPNKSQYYVIIKGRDNDDDNIRQLRGRMLNYDDNLKAWRGLVSVVLQLLILHGNKCEKNIFNHNLFDKIDTQQFGSQKQIITELKQQKWIIEEKETTGDERCYYKIGIRANIETASEWQYNAAFQLVNNGMMPPHDDRALQNILREKQNRNNNRNNNRNRGRNNASQRSQRGRRGRGRGS